MKNHSEIDDEPKFLLDQRIDGVLLLSGDRRFTEMLKTERPGSYPLYELTCSPLTSGIPSNLDQEKINPQIVPGTFTAQRNFCTLDFQGTKAERKIVVRSFSTEGEKLWEQTIAVKELKAPPCHHADTYNATRPENAVDRHSLGPIDSQSSDCGDFAVHLRQATLHSC